MVGSDRVSAGAVFLGLIRLGAMATLAVIFGIFFLTWWGQGQAMRDIDHKSAISSQEDVFRTVCPSYKKASTWDRWTDSYIRRIGWCADYVDRL